MYEEDSTYILVLMKCHLRNVSRVYLLQIVWDPVKNRYVNTEEDHVDGDSMDKKVLAPPKDIEVTQNYGGGGGGGGVGPAASTSFTSSNNPAVISGDSSSNTPSSISNNKYSKNVKN